MTHVSHDRLGAPVWRTPGRGPLIRGRLQGITNAGISRSPLRVACEECHNPGAMIGRLCGTVVRSLTRPDLLGALVTAVYRFEVDPTEQGGEGRLAGVVEGALVQECAGEAQCVDFATVVAGSNPLVEQGHRIEVFDHAGAPQPQTEIVTWGATTGLHMWFRTTIDLASPADAVRLTIARFATAGTVTAFDASGNQVAQAPITGM